MRHIFTVLCLQVACAAFGATAPIDLLVQPVTLTEGETRSLALPQTSFVHKLFIQAEGVGSAGAYAEVSAEADVKGTLYMPGSDPHYVVTVEARTRSIEVTSLRGRTRLLAVKAFLSPDGQPEEFPTSFHSKMGKYSYEIIQLADALERYSSYPDLGEFLLPAKKKAAVSYAVAEAQGDLSGVARPYYEQLLASLDHATPYFHRMLELEEATELTVRTLAVRERVRSLLK